MCSVCGCGHGETHLEGQALGAHDHAQHPEHHDAHDHHHDEAGGHTHPHGHSDRARHSHAPGLSESRMVQIEQDILAKNNTYAAANRAFFESRGILALNLVSSPGSGKTTLLVRTIEELGGQADTLVIEGDQQTANDAARIRETGAKAAQINTGRGCHLDGHMVGHALESLSPGPGTLLFVENVGNLVCPASFDLGEAAKVVILSVTEGEDKPLKYPDMFHAAEIMLLNKIDLLPYLDFDRALCIANARKVNPGIKVIAVSAKTGEGIADWYRWIAAKRSIAAIGSSDAAETAKG
jgi:hydrogenase nickel incorporation protein HypB